MRTVVGPSELVYKNAISYPAPEYPLEARRRRLTGKGLFEAKISRWGEVESVTVLTSTGHAILDKAAISTIKKWRFRANTGMVGVRVPITFSIPEKTKAPKKT